MTLQPQAQPYEWTFRRVVWATLALLLVILGFWLLYRFVEVVFILFIAIVIGTVLRPALNWLQHRGLHPTAGLLLIYLVLSLLFAGFLFLLLPMIVGQATTIAADIPAYYLGVRAWMLGSSNALVLQLSDFLPAALPSLALTPPAAPQAMASAGQALGYVSSLASLLFLLIVMLVLAYYWTLDGPRILQSLFLLIPRGQRESISELVSAMEARVGSYLVGQAVLCLVIGGLALLAYLLIGLPNALVLALIAGVLEVIPMIGPLLGALPAALVALSIAPVKLLWVIVATIVIQQIENSLLVPRIMRRAVGVNPFITLVAIFAFSSLFGITGALMAIPMAAVIQLLLGRFVFHPGAMDMETSSGRDHASRLRYEAQQLAQGLRRQARLTKTGSDREIRQVDQVMDEIETIATDLDALLAGAVGEDPT